MFVLTAADMREVDRRTMETGLSGPLLMENAGHRVVEFLAARFQPLTLQRIVILCGKGNNGGDGLVIARQLHTRFRPASLDVVLAAEAPENMPSLLACGFHSVTQSIQPRMRAATLVIDALLGTGLTGAPREPYASLIAEINSGFPGAKVVAVDLPSGMASDSAETPWPEVVRAHHTVTFTAPKLAQVLEPNASLCGELIVGHIGSPGTLLPAHTRLAGPADFTHLFTPRPPTAHKGTFGHVLVVGGTPGKSGAAAMTGLAALRAGAGLVTVASDAAALPAIAAHAPELMTEPLRDELLEGKRAVAIGPGLGVSPEKSAIIRRLLTQSEAPTVIDADGLNNLAGGAMPRRQGLILTPHPGEMSRLLGGGVVSLANRLELARTYARDHALTLVLKGRNTLTALADGSVWINPTGGPAMATGGSGDILTGLIAGLAAQFPDSMDRAVVAAVWLHGRAGDLAAAELGEKCVIATDLLKYLPRAMHEIHHPV